MRLIHQSLKHKNNIAIRYRSDVAQSVRMPNTNHTVAIVQCPTRHIALCPWETLNANIPSTAMQLKVQFI